MNQTERRKLDNQLIVMGLHKLEDPRLLPALGQLVPNHQFFRSLLNECVPEKRREMYEALRPHLKFQPKPLDVYMAELTTKASEIASRAEPIVVGDDKFEQVNPADATEVIATLTCYKCTRQQEFIGKTPADAAIQARNAGWVRDLVKNKEVCPKCPIYFPV